MFIFVQMLFTFDYISHVLECLLDSNAMKLAICYFDSFYCRFALLFRGLKHKCSGNIRRDLPAQSQKFIIFVKWNKSMCSASSLAEHKIKWKSSDSKCNLATFQKLLNLTKKKLIFLLEILTRIEKIMCSNSKSFSVFMIIFLVLICESCDVVV